MQCKMKFREFLYLCIVDTKKKTFPKGFGYLVHRHRKCEISHQIEVHLVT